jgi:hypothetical protein
MRLEANEIRTKEKRFLDYDTVFFCRVGVDRRLVHSTQGTDVNCRLPG